MIQNLTEWDSYLKAPSARTLALLNRSVFAQGQEGTLVASLHQALLARGCWRIAQHLAIVCLNRGYLIHATYFAKLAVRKSSGNILARLVYADVLWARRIPAGVFTQLEILRFQRRNLRGQVKSVARLRMVELSLLAYAYLGDSNGIRKRTSHASIYHRLSVETLVQLLFACGSKNAPDILRRAAVELAKRNAQLGPLPTSLVRRGLLLNITAQVEAMK